MQVGISKMTRSAIITTPLGEMLAAADEGGLTGLWFAGQKHFPDTCDFMKVHDDPLFANLQKELDRYFAGRLTVFSVPINLRGAPFQLVVWEELLRIPFGKTTTYGRIAETLFSAAKSAERIKRVSARAVGGAVGHNPISILAPCHRVIGHNGKLTGYAGGLWRKEKLLSLEGHAGFALQGTAIISV